MTVKAGYNEHSSQNTRAPTQTVEVSASCRPANPPPHRTKATKADIHN